MHIRSCHVRGAGSGVVTGCVSGVISARPTRLRSQRSIPIGQPPRVSPATSQPARWCVARRARSSPMRPSARGVTMSCGCSLRGRLALRAHWPAYERPSGLQLGSGAGSSRRHRAGAGCRPSGALGGAGRGRRGPGRCVLCCVPRVVVVGDERGSITRGCCSCFRSVVSPWVSSTTTSAAVPVAATR